VTANMVYSLHAKHRGRRLSHRTFAEASTAILRPTSGVHRYFSRDGASICQSAFRRKETVALEDASRRCSEQLDKASVRT